MTKPRDGPFVWITWLSKRMVGEVTCRWAPWFRTHYTGYTKAPSDFQLAQWTTEHTRLLDEMARERVQLGEVTYLEGQNYVRVKRASGTMISGKPDLIAIDKRGRATIYDAKTGSPRQSDLIQVMLYMAFMPYSSALYKGKKLRGCVVYQSGQRSDIPAEGIDDAFGKNVTYFLDLLESPEPPTRTPISAECRFCDIGVEDCPERVETDGESQEPTIPL